MKHSLAVASLGCLVALGCYARTERIQLSERSPLSSPEEFAARRGHPLHPADRGALVYDLASESFELYVPAAVEKGGPRVGLVWVGPGASGAPPRSWAAVLDRHRVLWMGANASGNQRSPPDRINLALDAAEHLAGLLQVEPSSIYVGGFSGGARIASEAALLYPDVFAGGLFAGAADYFRLVRSSDPRWEAWEPTFPPPPPERLQLARSRRRYAFLTGSRDPNRALVQDVHRAFLADGFSAADFLEVPDLGHELPPAERFEEALVQMISGEPRGQEEE